MAIDALKQYQDLGLKTVEKKSKNDATLQQDQFLELMTTQLTHQDPLEPMDNGDFLGQMAQFSAVSGIQDLQKSFESFSSSISSGQALQAATLVGRYVSAPSSEGLLSAGGSVSGEFTLPASSPEVTLKIIEPASGEVVKTMDLGVQAKGNVAFEWDGITQNNEMANPGVYKIQVEAKIDGKNTALQTRIKSRVDSVTLGQGSNGLLLNLEGLDAVKFNQVKQIS